MGGSNKGRTFATLDPPAPFLFCPTMARNPVLLVPNLITIARILAIIPIVALVMNGDILTTLDFGDLLAFHRRERPALTVAVRSQEVTFDYGVLEIGDDATVTAYIEKPTTQYKCSMGIYVYSPEAIRAIVPGEPLDVPALVRRLLDRGERVAAYHSDPYWLDVGHRENLEQAIEDFPRMRAALLPDESPDASGVADEPLARDRSAGGAC